jgi:hypothetical protein
MAKRLPARSSVEVIAAIDQKAVRVREAADALTQRITDFEAYLASLRGKVECYAFGDHPDADEHDNRDLELGLWFHRVGKAWIISVCDYTMQMEAMVGLSWQPLKDASLKIKIGAVKAFPVLLEAIEQRQDSLITELEKVAKEYDVFAATLKSNDSTFASKMTERSQENNGSGGGK